MVNRRAIIIVCVLIVIGIPLIVGFGSNHPSKNIATALSGKATKEGLTAYQENEYTFYYPKEWQPQAAPRADGTGTEVYIAPQPEDTTTMKHVTIDVLDANKTTLSATRHPYVSYNYPEEDTTVAGIPAKKYAKVDPTSEGTYHTIVYIFQKGETVYLLKLGYKQDPIDAQLENQFTQMVSVFTLK